MCVTNGQCPQMNATSSAGAWRKSSVETTRPLKSGRENDGSRVPSGSIVEGVRTMNNYQPPTSNAQILRLGELGVGNWELMLFYRRLNSSSMMIRTGTGSP